MAWQNSAAGMGNGGSPGGGGGGGEGNNHSQSQGTEYTLQGVMRFLQTEWHRHERDRNTWEIERAEMKSRIGKLEGDARTNKRLQEALGKHVKILEHALKKEREKVKTLQSGETAEEKTEDSIAAKDSPKLGQKPPITKPHNSFLDVENVESGSSELKQDTERDKSRVYLHKCIQEVMYHVVPTTAAQQQLADEQEQMLQQNHQFQNQQLPQQSLEDVYVQQRHKQPLNHVGSIGPPSLLNHQAPPIPRIPEMPLLARNSQQSEHASFMSRNLPDAQSHSQSGPVTSIDTRRQNYGFPHTSDEQIEKILHKFDAYGQPMSGQEQDENTRNSEASQAHDSADTDGWNFEDSPEPNHEEPQHQQQEYPVPQRPDTDVFPIANELSLKSTPRSGPGSHRRKSSLTKRRQSDGSHELRDLSLAQGASNKGEPSTFKVRFALRGHLDVVRSVIFTGGGSPSEPEICTTGDDGVIKRWIIPASYGSFGSHGASSDLDIPSYFTHRGHTGAVMALAASPASQIFSNGGRALGDGWVFSGGQDATVRVWERGRVDPKATLNGHTDAIWTICVLPGSSASALGEQCSHHGGPDRIVLASGSADGTILIWAVSAPPMLTSPHQGSRRGAGGSRRANSVSSGSNFPSSPQPSTATTIPFHYSLVHRIERADRPSPTCISPLSMSGESFVVSYNDASVLIYDTRTAEEIVGMASTETYDGTLNTGVNAVAAKTIGFDGSLSYDSSRGTLESESLVHGATGSTSSVEGEIISGHEDTYIRIFDANSGQCAFSMLAHPSAISALSVAPDGLEMVSGGHDAGLRFWSLETRTCKQEITSHRLMRGEGVCAVVWSQDGRWVVSGGGDGVVKVFARS